MTDGLTHLIQRVNIEHEAVHSRHSQDGRQLLSVTSKGRFEGDVLEVALSTIWIFSILKQWK